MILEVSDILRSLVPSLVADGVSLSVAKVQTTRPIFLAFGESGDRPLCVVQFGPRPELERLHLVLLELHRALPDVVPNSLACAPCRNDSWVHVQGGLSGTPWFRLPGRFRTLDAWMRLRSRALATLWRFQKAVEDVPAWVTAIDPAEELLRQWHVCEAGGRTFPPAVGARVRASAAALRTLGPLQGARQHGDYCFNNLLVASDAVGLIDFEEFGHTSMPLHDEFSLAFSAHDFMSALAGTPTLQAQISACVCDSGAGKSMGPGCIEGLLFHHLVWRLNQCATRPRRAAIADVLAGHILRLASDRSFYLGTRR
jgi:hypothetical protein